MIGLVRPVRRVLQFALEVELLDRLPPVSSRTSTRRRSVLEDAADGPAARR
ncbi:hypothetical protein [Rubrivirga sp.]|uniref:hypothetical protein n=1 Tax=Rubrivirga sp. TaxID=1885344 RepID=UPI003C76DA38